MNSQIGHFRKFAKNEQICWISAQFVKSGDQPAIG